jgi:MinD-like ATPase involved in chromosome partitioning or flagellar assembly
VTVPVLTAVTGATWEAALVAGLERTPTGITVVRRCVDLADLLAVASTGTARAALLSAELRRLDRDALSRLAAARVAVVGLYSPGDESAGTRLRQLGVVHVLPADAPPADISAAVADALQEQDPAGAAATAAWSRPLEALPAVDDPEVPVPPAEPGTGRLVAVWGPTGAPGRTTVAVGLAGELAAQGVSALLADADVYGGVVAQVLGLLDEAPGLAAAVRMANNGVLDVAALAKAAPQAAPNLRVLTGISRADRWPELRPAALEQVWELARSLAAVTVVDCAFCLEQDEELSFDTSAPRRNGATLATLAQADVVLAVGTGDPVGMQRLVRGISQLREAVPGVLPRVVVNRVRHSAVGPEPQAQLREALDRYASVRDVTFVPEDREGLDAAVLQARPLAEVSPDSPAREAIAALAAGLVGRSVPRRRHRLLRRGA